LCLLRFFSELVEDIKVIENDSFNPDRFIDLAASLKSFFSQPNVKQLINQNNFSDSFADLDYKNKGIYNKAKLFILPFYFADFSSHVMPTEMNSAGSYQQDKIFPKNSFANKFFANNLDNNANDSHINNLNIKSESFQYNGFQVITKKCNLYPKLSIFLL
jgi:hypothetical protein